MADSFDQASGQIDENKRAMLAAMAQAGTAGVQAYQRAQTDLAAQKQAAVTQALAGAAAGYAPQALQDQLRATVSSPYDRYTADLTAARSYGEQSNAAAQAANASYFDQAKAAIPALRTYAQAQAQDHALDRQLKELDLQKKQMDLQSATGGGPGGILPMLKNQYGTDAGVNRALLTTAKQYVTEHGGNWGHKGTTALLEQFDNEAGLPTGYTRALLKPAKTTAAANDHKSAVVDHVTKKYGSGSRTAKAITILLAGSKSYADAIANLNDGLAAAALWKNGGEDDDGKKQGPGKLGSDVFLTPGGKYLSRSAIIRLLRQAYGG